MPFANDCLDTIGVCPNRLYRVSAGQCTCGEQLLQLIDPGTSEVLDLTKYGIPETSSSSSSSPSPLAEDWCCVPNTFNGTLKHGVEIVTKEMSNSLQYCSTMALVKNAEDAAKGVVYIPIDTVNSAKAGVFLGMAIVWEHGVMKRHFPFYFDVLPNLASYNPSGPITFYEVRLAVRDMCPEMNFLIDAVEFKDEEIAWAMRRPIDYWNEIPPPVATHSPVDFPYRYHWLDATIGELLITVAVWMRRNDLDYSAAGLSVDDTKKWPVYMKMGQERLAEYKEFVKNKKIEININGAYTSMGGYRHNPYR